MLQSEAVMINHLEMNPPFPSLTEYEEIAVSMYQILTVEIRTVFCGGKILFQCYAHDIFRTSILSLFGCTNPFLKHAQNTKESFYVSIT